MHVFRNDNFWKRKIEVKEAPTSNHKSKTIGLYPNIGQQVEQHNKLQEQGKINK